MEKWVRWESACFVSATDKSGCGACTCDHRTEEADAGGIPSSSHPFLEMGGGKFLPSTVLVFLAPSEAV